MKKAFKIIIIALLLIAAAAISILYIQNNNIAVLEPKGMIGIKEKDLIITSSLLMLIVVIPVLILTWIFAWKYHEKNEKARHAPDWEHNAIAEYCWWGVPIVIISILAVITWKSSHELNPFKPIESNKKALTIQVVALQWKWLFLYPEQGIATLGYVEFPAQTPIHFEVTADAPMNSFWIPQLGGQIYAMPAMRSQLHLIADEEGIFRGASANFSGTGFAGMTFTAKATSEAEFDAWVKSGQSAGQVLNMQQYNDLVKPSANNPTATYVLQQRDLFDQILMKYMEPPKK